MGIFTTLPVTHEEVDVIVIGGGSAGCIIASRLSDAFPQMPILLIEGGDSNANVPSLTHPAMLMSNLAPDSKYNIYYKAGASDQVAGRELVVPAGNVLGGGSSVNLMVYTRPARSDFDSWPTPGWSADEMLGYMNKAETYLGPNNGGLHGRDGPIHISGSRFRSSRLEDDFINAANAAGWSEVQDLQTLDGTSAGNVGIQRAMRYVDLQGRRQDTAHQYLFPRIEDGDHPNLHVLLQSKVARVVFAGQRAVGVEYQSNQGLSEDEHDASRIVKARKMVVVSCGALGSPLVLERSGIGDPGILRAAGIPVVANVPDVGKHYQDHHMMTYCYKSSLEPEQTVDAIASGRANLQDLIRRDEPILGWNSVDAYCKLRPRVADVPGLGLAFEKKWREEYQNRPDRPLMLVSLAGGFPGDHNRIPEGQYFCIAAFSGYPLSRGEIHITGPNLECQPKFHTGFFTDPNDVDVKKHVWMYKTQREIVRRMKVFRGELAGSHPEFPPGSQATWAAVPVQDPVSPVQYDEQDEVAIENWIRGNVGTTWHSLGTCRMSTVREGGVVDPNLNVYGVEGMKVADLSISPSNLGCNTNSVALAIGEKAADIFIRELRLSGE
ncbi:GMC oxidoreductase [Xylariaceae sp. FL0255]|nr:GMC oxidoreductase [Xylariaceae sp. FL0255]